MLDGYYSNNIGTRSCKTCQDNSFSNKARDGCICKEGYYMNKNNVCEECSNTDFFGDSVYILDTAGLTINTLKNEDGYWRSNPYTTDFYKCRMKDYCPKNLIINNTITCLEYHTGILCDMCISGYAKNNNGLCEKCSDLALALTPILTFTIISYIVLICTSLIYGNKTSPKTRP